MKGQRRWNWNNPGKYADKPCGKCGEMFTPTGGNTKYCPRCKVIAEQEVRQRRYERRRKRLRGQNAPELIDRGYLDLDTNTPCSKCELRKACTILVGAPGAPWEEKVFVTDEPFCWPASGQHRVWWEYQVVQCWKRHRLETPRRDAERAASLRGDALAGGDAPQRSGKAGGERGASLRGDALAGCREVRVTGRASVRMMEVSDDLLRVL